MRSALLAADLVLIPVQPSPFDGWASAEMLRLVEEARVYRPQLAVRFLLNRCAARTVIARETAETLADHDPPLLATTIGQRVTFADTARSRSEEHTSELQSLMRISYAVFCLNKKNNRSTYKSLHH